MFLLFPAFPLEKETMRVQAKFIFIVGGSNMNFPVYSVIISLATGLWTVRKILWFKYDGGSTTPSSYQYHWDISKKHWVHTMKYINATDYGKLMNAKIMWKQQMRLLNNGVIKLSSVSIITNIIIGISNVINCNYFEHRSEKCRNWW